MYEGCPVSVGEGRGIEAIASEMYLIGFSFWEDKSRKAAQILLCQKSVEIRRGRDFIIKIFASSGVKSFVGPDPKCVA